MDGYGIVIESVDVSEWICLLSMCEIRIPLKYIAVAGIDHPVAMEKK